MSHTIKDITPPERSILSQLRWRPALYLGVKSLRNFEHMTNGYEFAMNIAKESVNHIILPDMLNEYTAKYLNVPQDVRNAFGLIAEREPDDEKALDLFFDILDSYLLFLGYAPIPDWNEANNDMDVKYLEKEDPTWAG